MSFLFSRLKAIAAFIFLPLLVMLREKGWDHLDFQRTIRDTLAFPFVYRRALLQRSLLPLIAVPLTVAFAFLYFGQESSLLHRYVAFELPCLLLLAPIPIVGLLRAVQLKEPPNLGWLHFRLSRPELLAFLGAGLMVLPALGGLAAFLGAGALVGLSGLRTLLPLLGEEDRLLGLFLSLPAAAIVASGLYLSARLSLLVPVAATGNWPDPRTAWRFTRGSGWALLYSSPVPLLFSAMALFVMPMLTAAASFELLGDPPAPLRALVWCLVLLPAQALFYGFSAGFLLSIWKQLTEPKLFAGRPV